MLLDKCLISIPKNNLCTSILGLKVSIVASAKVFNKLEFEVARQGIKASIFSNLANQKIYFF